MKFVWRRLVFLFALGSIAISASIPIHELGHASFAVGLGGRITKLSFIFGYCDWEGLDGLRENIALAGGMIFSLLVGSVLLVLLVTYKDRIIFQLKFFLFCLLSTLLLGNIGSYLIVQPLQYLAQGLAPGVQYVIGDVIMLIERGIPAPIFLMIGFLLTWLVLFPLRYLEFLTRLYVDTVNYVVKGVKVEMREVST